MRDICPKFTVNNPTNEDFKQILSNSPPTPEARRVHSLRCYNHGILLANRGKFLSLFHFNYLSSLLLLSWVHLSPCILSLVNKIFNGCVGFCRSNSPSQFINLRASHPLLVLCLLITPIVSSHCPHLDPCYIALPPLSLVSSCLKIPAIPIMHPSLSPPALMVPFPLSLIGPINIFLPLCITVLLTPFLLSNSNHKYG